MYCTTNHSKLRIGALHSLVLPTDTEHLHSSAATTNDKSAHRSLTVAYFIKSGKLCADSWFMQDVSRKCHLSPVWNLFSKLRLSDKTQRADIFGNKAMVQKLGEFILLKLSLTNRKCHFPVLQKRHKVALI